MATETARDGQLPSTSVSPASDDAERSDEEERRICPASDEVAER